MKRLGKTKIPWADLGWSPIVGCLNACGVTADNPAGWCYARRIATTRLAHLCPECATFTPHCHIERDEQPLTVRKPAVIFADAMSDWWSEGVEQEWRESAYAIMGDNRSLKHRFVLLTKRPERITAEDVEWWPTNAWLGVSITSGADWWRWEALAKLPIAHRFISVEPLLGDAVGGLLFGESPYPEWVIVGPMSGSGAIRPDAFWQEDIRTATVLRGVSGLLPIPLFEKPGLPLQPPIRQMPAELARVFRKGGVEAL